MQIFHDAGTRRYAVTHDHEVYLQKVMLALKLQCFFTRGISAVRSAFQSTVFCRSFFSVQGPSCVANLRPVGRNGPFQMQNVAHARESVSWPKQALKQALTQALNLTARPPPALSGVRPPSWQPCVATTQQFAPNPPFLEPRAHYAWPATLQYPLAPHAHAAAPPLAASGAPAQITAIAIAAALHTCGSGGLMPYSCSICGCTGFRRQ